MTHQKNKPVPSDPIVSHSVTVKRRATPDHDGINHHVRSGHRMATGEILDRICLFLRSASKTIMLDRTHDPVSPARQIINYQFDTTL